MKGSIRMAAGFMIMFGSVGTLEVDPTASVIKMALIGLIGAAIAFSGVKAMKEAA